MTATPRENLLRTLRRQGFDWTPLDPQSFCNAQVEAFRLRFGHTDIAGFFNAPFRGCFLPLRPSYPDGRALYPRETLPADAVIDVWGVGHSPQPNCWHMTHMHHPLAGDVTVREVREYPLPAIAPNALESLRSANASIHAQGLAARGEMACTLWEIGWYIRSMEDLMADMMTDDERAVIHLDRLTDHSCRRIRLYAEADTDIIQLGDDIGMQNSVMMSPALWRAWLKPRLARIIAEARRVKPDILIFYHSCGLVTPFLEDFVEVGINILNPVQPECMDFDDVHARVGGRLSFWSTIGTQTTLPFGTPDDVKAVVRSRLKTCGKAGGIVIGPTHMVEPEVPWENLLAMKDAVGEPAITLRRIVGGRAGDHP